MYALTLTFRISTLKIVEQSCIPPGQLAVRGASLFVALLGFGVAGLRCHPLLRPGARPSLPADLRRHQRVHRAERLFGSAGGRATTAWTRRDSGGVGFHTHVYSYTCTCMTVYAYKHVYRKRISLRVHTR